MAASTPPTASAMRVKRSRYVSAPVFVTSSLPGSFACPQSVGVEIRVASRTSASGMSTTAITTRTRRWTSTATLGARSAHRSGAENSELRNDPMPQRTAASDRRRVPRQPLRPMNGSRVPEGGVGVGDLPRIRLASAIKG